MSTTAIGFIGSGQMATALAKGWVASSLIDPDSSIAADPFEGARTIFRTVTGIRSTASNAEAIRKVLVLAVKPQMMPGVLAELQPLIPPGCLIISIAAGVTLAALEISLGPHAIVRVMPNTPCLLGMSASGIAFNSHTSPEQQKLVQTLFSSVGVALTVPEKLLDAVTGLSGSGPAYVYTFIEALADGGVKMGLPRETALKLAAQTVLGSAQMVLEAGQHPAALRDAVASPGGTTIAGMHELEKAAFRAGVMNAVEAATRRASELGATDAGKR